MMLSFFLVSASGFSKAGATVIQLMVAATWPVASIGASAAGSVLRRSTLAGSMPFACSTSGQATFEDEKVAVATFLPTTSLSAAMPEPSVVKIASGCRV